MWHHLATFGASTTFCERKTVGNTVKREISALTHQKNCNITFFFFLCQTCFVFLHVYYYLICLSVSSHDINDFNPFKIHLDFNPQPNSHQPFQIKSKMIAQWWTITAVFFFCFFFWIRCDNHTSSIIINFTQGHNALNMTERQRGSQCKVERGKHLYLPCRSPLQTNTAAEETIHVNTRLYLYYKAFYLNFLHCAIKMNK